MFFNVPGGTLNTDGFPLSVVAGPDWLNVTLGIAGLLVLVTLAVILGRGNRTERRQRHRPAPGLRWLAAFRNVCAFTHRYGAA